VQRTTAVVLAAKVATLKFPLFAFRMATHELRASVVKGMARRVKRCGPRPKIHFRHPCLSIKFLETSDRIKPSRYKQSQPRPCCCKQFSEGKRSSRRGRFYLGSYLASSRLLTLSITLLWARRRQMHVFTCSLHLLNETGCFRAIYNIYI
jgi:hypothetical protein